MPAAAFQFGTGVHFVRQQKRTERLGTNLPQYAVGWDIPSSLPALSALYDQTGPSAHLGTALHYRLIRRGWHNGPARPESTSQTAASPKAADDSFIGIQKQDEWLELLHAYVERATSTLASERPRSTEWDATDNGQIWLVISPNGSIADGTRGRAPQGAAVERLREQNRMHLVW
ncbi:hypothetical protein CTA2_1555 [Colletotrichum tanaceti]|nr:hypothetical protein CTA2_1555 [Colletotrichum tanaceti]